MLTSKVEGEENLQRDFDEFNRDVSVAASYGLRTVASELTPALQRHIQKDVYETYMPARYQRRHDHPQYGRSIYDADNMSLALSRSGGRESVEFTYEPNGYNAHYPTSDYYADGDSLIKVLQEDRYYLWLDGGGIGKERRFWDNFVEEVIKEGDQWFVQGFNQYDPSIQATADGAVMREMRDYQLDPTGEVKRG